VVSETSRGSNWIVTSGLADGDQLIVSNFAKARPGTPAKAVPTGSAQAVQAGAPAPAPAKQ